MEKFSLNWKIGGEAGEGIMVTGLIFSKACASLGYEVFNYAEYPSRIRGGHNCYQVKIQDKKPITAEYGIDILVALNKETIELHLNEMNSNGIIIFDSAIKDFDLNIPGLYPVPLEELAIKAGGKITKNNVAIGVCAGLIDMPYEALERAVKKAFKDKGEHVQKINIEAIKEGYYFAKNTQPDFFKIKMTNNTYAKKYVITGNEAIALGAVKAGLKLYAAYPMTPASSILHFLSPLERKYRIIVKHTEDEIAAILTAIGSSFAGIRSMAATSGGGFSLMTEALGMASITETPLVIVECMRPGPSTGMPTWTEQGDLRFVMHASQGDFIRVILTPGDVSEAYQLIQLAFNLAEKYQIPVILLSDKFLSESSESVDNLTQYDLPKERGKRLKDVPENFKRYDLSIEDGISWRAFPPSPNGMQLANSDEHDEYGLVTEEKDLRIAMVEKRMKRLESIKKEIPKPKIYGETDAEVSLIGFGSVKNPILRAMEYIKHENIKVNFLHCICPHPFVKEHYIDFVNNAKRLICIENNYFGQFASILQENLLIEIKEKLLKFDGRPFFPHEIVEYIKRRI
jgi:2-oxoglutarate ferredoxin oxidoreductase subunit alpha